MASLRDHAVSGRDARGSRRPRRPPGRRPGETLRAGDGAANAAARSEGLEATAAALGRALSTVAVAEIAVQEGLARLGAGRGVVAVLDADGHTVQTLAAIGFSHDVVAGWPTFDITDDAPLSEAMRLREPIILDTPEEIRDRYPQYGQVPLDGGPAIVVPLLYEDRAVGGLYFRYAAPAEPKSDRSFLLALGRQCAAALERARLYDANTRANARLASRLRGQEAVARLGQAAVVHSELEPLFEAAARELADVLDGDITAIMQHLPARGALRIVAGAGWRDGVVGRATISDNADSHSGFALLSDAPVVSTEYATDPRFRASSIVLQHGARSGVATPIVGPDGPWGVLGVHSRTPGRFDADQIALLDTFANVLGSAISRHSAEVAIDAERARRAEAERRQAELNQAFIGVLSHELRTPITSIYAGSKLLRRMSTADAGSLSPARTESRAGLTADIEAEAERLYRLTEDLLVLTRVERGTLEIGLEPVAMPRVLERVIASEQERWPFTTIELLVQPGIPIALGDNTYIEQLIRNLVGNAAKYAPPGETVQVVATATQPAAAKGQELEVRVLDRGPGLADADLAHLFDLFYRSPLTAKRAPGAGIGLFVCDHLAQAMGGRLWALNRDGGGAEFGFSLRPYVSEESGAAPARA